MPFAFSRIISCRSLANVLTHANTTALDCAMMQKNRMENRSMTNASVSSGIRHQNIAVSIAITSICAALMAVRFWPRRDLSSRTVRTVSWRQMDAPSRSDDLAPSSMTSSTSSTVAAFLFPFLFPQPAGSFRLSSPRDSSAAMTSMSQSAGFVLGGSASPSPKPSRCGTHRSGAPSKSACPFDINTR